MEWIVESKDKEQRKIFAILKNMFSLQAKRGRTFQRVEHVKFRVNIASGWQESAFNVFLKDHMDGNYMKLYTKRIGGKTMWIAVAKESKRQYRLVIQRSQS